MYDFLRNKFIIRVFRIRNKKHLKCAKIEPMFFGGDKMSTQKNESLKQSLETVIRRIEILRKQKAYTCKELAERSGVNLRRLYRWRQNPFYEVWIEELFRICRTLGIDILDLFFELPESISEETYLKTISEIEPKLRPLYREAVKEKAMRANE